MMLYPPSLEPEGRSAAHEDDPASCVLYYRRDSKQFNMALDHDCESLLLPFLCKGKLML